MHDVKASFHNVSHLSILMHGVISLSDAKSYDKCIFNPFDSDGISQIN